MSNVSVVHAAQAFAAPAHAFARAVIAGLSRSPKSLPCKYFYDDAGSRLFEQICALPEYYPTRTEIALLKRHAGHMARFIGPAADIVEFGAGSLEKISILLDALDCPRAYTPVDISGDYLQSMAVKLSRRHPDIAIRPVVADFTHPLKLAGLGNRAVGFFPGSTIGNFERDEALAFLARARALCAGGGLLIGADLVKDPAILHAAYNDSAGVTAAFNRNLLVRANRELGADFDFATFAHYAFYEPHRQRIEMHLVSLARQQVRIDDAVIDFAEGETIHTENSHKYTLDGFRALAREAGFEPRAVWCDPDRLFSIHWLKA